MSRKMKGKRGEGRNNDHAAFTENQGINDPLIRDLKKTTLSLRQLARKYGVSKQAISSLIRRKSIKRPERPTQEHTENCRICQGLLKIAKQPHSDFISSRTIKAKLKLQGTQWLYHIRIVRRKGLVSPRFGRLHSRKAELAYRIYFEKSLSVEAIGRMVGLKNLHSVIRKHKALRWDAPGLLPGGSART